MKHFVLKIELCGVCWDSVLHPSATQCLCECRRKCKVIARAGGYLQKGWMDGSPGEWYLSRKPGTQHELLVKEKVGISWGTLHVHRPGGTVLGLSMVSALRKRRLQSPGRQRGELQG